MSLIGFVGILFLAYLLSIPIVGWVLILVENRKVTEQEEEQNPFIVPQRVIQRIQDSRGFLIGYFGPFILIAYLIRVLIQE